MMRGTPGMRLVLGILSPIFLVLCVIAIRSEETRPWMRYQEEFKELYGARATAKVREAAARGDGAEEARWRRVADEVARARPEIEQIYLEDLQIADRCVTCHRGIDNPLFRDAAEPFRTHPGDLLRHHDVTVFGCTLCHDGQGAATTVAGAHGRTENWLWPLLPTPYLQASCARCHEVTHGLDNAEVVTRGADLFMDKGCSGCHRIGNIGDLPKFGPPLTQLRSKLSDARSWTYAWIKDPTALRPHTVMPHFELDDEAVGKVTAFLLTLPAVTLVGPVDLDGASREDGKRLFDERGCAGCHATQRDERSVSPRVPHLAGIGSKVTPLWLDGWLEDPRVYNPESAMPKVDLADGERRALVAYLLTLTRPDPLEPAPDLGIFDPEDGKQLVRRFECFGCHEIAGFEHGRPTVPDLAEFARKSVDDLDFGRTTDVPRTKWDWLRHKLLEPRAYETDRIELRMPAVELADDEAQAIVSYVLAGDAPVLPARHRVRATPAGRARRDLTWMMARLNCNGCHQVGGKDAGLARLPERRAAMPPSLDDVARRLPSHALYEFLLDPKLARPWAGMRMPDFRLTGLQAQTLVDGFRSVSAIANPYADAPVLNTVGPPLTALHEKLADPDWLVAWVLGPSHLRPGTAMPDIDPTPEEAQAIARHLYTDAARTTPAKPWRGGDPETGRRLFVSRGCRGCHAIEPGDRSIESRVPNLAGVGLKVRGDWLFAWLESPRSYSPGTAMPELFLGDDEIRHLVAFLLSRREGAESLAAAPRFDARADAARGRRAIESYGCVSCHEIEGFAPPRPPFELASAASAIASREAVLRDGRMLVAYHHCRGCHRIEGRTSAVAVHFERQTLVPPTLEGEGARVQPSWLLEFLQEPELLRPWTSIRMPNYGFSEAQARVLVRYFAALDGLAPTDEPLPTFSEEMTARGRQRFEHFQCRQCHPTERDAKPPLGVSPEDLSINLELARARLRPSWIREFLARPKAIVGTQTRMPTAFFSVDGAPKVDEPEQDIAAISAFILQMAKTHDAVATEIEAERERGRTGPRIDWAAYEY